MSSAHKLHNESSLGEKVEAIALHSEWLRNNHSILSTLYEYCLMVGTGHAELTGKKKRHLYQLVGVKCL